MHLDISTIFDPPKYKLDFCLQIHTQIMKTKEPSK